jgi:hypothetical protein
MASLDTCNEVKLSPTQLNWFRCDQCEYKSRQTGNLKRHKVTKHTPVDEVKWFNCDQCGFKTIV